MTKKILVKFCETCGGEGIIEPEFGHLMYPDEPYDCPDCCEGVIIETPEHASCRETPSYTADGGWNVIKTKALAGESRSRSS